MEDYVCNECGSNDVCRKHWVNINDGSLCEIIDDGVYFCRHCGEGTDIVTKSRFERNTIKEFVHDYYEMYPKEAKDEEIPNWVDQVGVGYYSKEQDRILEEISACTHPLTDLADRYALFYARLISR